MGKLMELLRLAPMPSRQLGCRPRLFPRANCRRYSRLDTALHVFGLDFRLVPLNLHDWFLRQGQAMPKAKIWHDVSGHGVLSLSPEQVSWWQTITDDAVFQDMYTHCDLVRAGTANAVQISQCGCGSTPPTQCVRQTSWAADPPPDWFRIDLMGVFQVEYVIIYNRFGSVCGVDGTDACNITSRGASVRVGNSPDPENSTICAANIAGTLCALGTQHTRAHTHTAHSLSVWLQIDKLGVQETRL